MFQRHRISIMATVLMATIWGPPLQSYAASPEQRCNELGANCLCSEPLQMTAFAVNGFWRNPNDSTTKECNGELVGTGYAITVTGDEPQVGTNASILAALPAGHSVQRFMRFPEGQTGGQHLQQYLLSAPRQRVAVRWYRYYSSNYQFKTGSCTNAMKWFIPYPGGGQWDTNSGQNGSPNIYGIEGTIGGQSNIDCCSWGPISVSGGLGGITTGRWFRYEVILRGWTGSGSTTRMEGYRKDVTAGTPEQKVVDTFESCSGCGTGVGWPGGTLAMSGGTLERVEINMFRTGSCSGFSAYSHAMVAAWSTDAGQRIGAASEVEGGTGSSPPAAPATLRITKLMQRLWGALWSTPPVFAR